MKEAVKADQRSFCKWFQQPHNVGLQVSMSFFKVQIISLINL